MNLTFWRQSSRGGRWNTCGELHVSAGVILGDEVDVLAGGTLGDKLHVSDGGDGGILGDEVNKIIVSLSET